MTSRSELTARHEAELDPAGLAAWQDLARDLRVKGCRETTRYGYLLALAQLRGHLEHRVPLLAVSRDQVAGFLIGREEWSPATVNTRYRALRRFYRWAHLEEIIAADPVARIPEPKLPSALTPVLSDGQLHALLKACAGKGFFELRDTAIIRLMCEAGTPRAAELCGMLLADVDMSGDVVLIRGKGQRERLIPFGAAAGRALSKYLRARAQQPDAARPEVWLGRGGGRGNYCLTRSGLYQMLERRSARAGLPRVWPHQLRHTSYHRFDQAGGSGNAAQKLFGWSSDAMTRVYGASAAARRAVEQGRELAIGDAL